MTRIASKHVFGSTGFSDWSAREVQYAELKVGKRS